MILGCYFVAHCVTKDASALVRMITLCSVLLVGMKWLVYWHWRCHGGRGLSSLRWLGFCLLWFGMDPAAWEKRVLSSLSWKAGALKGLGCLVGGYGALCVFSDQGVDNLLLNFVAMSLSFHYGVLSLLTAFWRLIGIPVRPLFRNPLQTLGFADFWSRRWNLAYSGMMARVVKRPLSPKLGESLSLQAVFITSGLLHELAITVPVGSGYGLPTLFFVIQGTFTTWLKCSNRVCGALCLLSISLMLPLLFPVDFFNQVILPVREICR